MLMFMSSGTGKRVLRTTCQAQAPGFESEYFSIDTAPVLIPEGPWTEIQGSVLAPKGFTGNGMYSKMRAGAKGDLAVVACDAGAVAAGAFTQNVMCAAPVTVCKDVLAKNSSSIKAVRSCFDCFPLSKAAASNLCEQRNVRHTSKLKSGLVQYLVAVQ